MTHFYITTIRLLFLSVFIAGCGIQAQIESLLGKPSSSDLLINNKVPFVVVNSLNHTNFSLSGLCSVEEGVIDVKVNGVSYGTTSCENQAWTKLIDFSALADGTDHSLQVTLSSVEDASLNFSDSAVLLKDVIPPVIMGVDDNLLPTESASASWSCVDANVPCSFRYQVTNNAGFIFLTEAFESVTSTTISQKGVQFLYVQAVDLAGNPSNTIQADHYIGSPRVYIEGVNALVTDSGNVDLQVLAVPSLLEMAIYNNANCTGVPTWIPTASSVSDWSLDPSHEGGVATVGIKFRTSTLQETPCFSDTIKWVTRPESVMCDDLVASGSSGRLVDSGGLGGNYANDEYCGIEVLLPGTPIRVTVQSLDLEEDEDYLEAWADDDMVFSLTGNVMAQSFVTSATELMLEFYSNSSVTRPGFVLIWGPVSADQPEFQINGGDDYTFSSTVNVELPEDSSLTEYYLTESSGCTSGGTWQALTPTRAWTFSNASEGVKSLYVKFRNAFGNETTCEGDSIFLQSPSLNLLTHSNGDLVGSSFTLGGDCFPNSATVELSHGGTTATTTCSGEFWSISSTTGLADGANLAATLRLVYGGQTLLTLNPSFVVSTLAPVAVISGLPTGASIAASFTATIAGTNVSEYRYKYGPSVDCSDSADYSSERNTALTVTVNQAAFPAGPVTFCAVGLSSINGSWQSFASASSVTWTKEVAVGVNFVGSHEVLAEGQGGVQLQVVLDSIQASSTRIHYGFAGDALYLVDHNLPAGYIDIPAGQTLGAVSFDVFSDALVNGDRELRVYISHSNKSSLEVGKRHMKVYTIKDDDQVYLTAQKFSFSRYNGCGIWSDDKLRCWGVSNTQGEIGSGTTGKVYGMIEPDVANLYSEVSVNDEIACAITQDDKLKCWGDNGSGALGVGGTVDRLTPAPVDSATDYRFISANKFVSCGITTADKLFCWGRNDSGQIGDGSGLQQSFPVPVDAAEDYLAVSSDGWVVCGITTSNDLKCWGSNSQGSFGNGGTTNSTTPVVAAGGIKFKKISVGNTTCGINMADQVMCWGMNDYGAVGNGLSGTDVTSPFLVDSATLYKEISASADYSCGVTMANQLKCWGTLPGGLLMEQSVVRLSPTALNDGISYNSIRVTQYGTCGITTTGDVACFGDPWNQSFNPEELPKATLVDATSTYSQVSIGEYNVIAMKTSGEVVVMGTYASPIDYLYSPVVQEQGASYAGGGVSSGSRITCYWDATGAAKCVGNNIGGTLGDGTNSSPTGFVSIAPGVNFSKIIHDDPYCAAGLDQTGRLYTWPMGCGNPSAGSDLPSLTDAGTIYTHVTGGYAYFGLTSTGLLKGWGNDDSGALGGVDRNSPTVLDGGTIYKAISTQGGTVCGITSADILKCWGRNNTYGKLGIGTTTNTSVPTVVDSINYKKVSVGGDYACGITEDNELKCWGRAGDFSGSTTNLLPILVDSGEVYKELVTANYGIAAITVGGVLKFWNRARFDQAPIVMAPGVEFIKLNEGGGGSGDFCAISSTNQLYCRNYYIDKASDNTFLPRIMRQFRLPM